MKHIKNSIKGSVYLLEHAGVPVALSTDFSEPIKNGSLCVDITNQDLYILRNNIWVKMGSGFNQDDWIPRQGTFINKPVYGDIEITDGIKFYSGQSSITFSDTQLLLEYSDNDGNTVVNNSLLLNRNIIIQKNDAILTTDTTSKDNFINKITTTISPGVQFSNSSNNIIESNLKFPTSFVNFNYNKLSGNINNEANFGIYNNSTLHINSNVSVNIFNGNSNNINISVEQSLPFSMLSNSYFNLRGRINGNNSTFNNNNNTYYDGYIQDSIINTNSFLNYQGHINYSYLLNNNYLYNLGHITGNNAGTFLGSASTTSLITQSTHVYNVGVLGAVQLNNLSNVTFFGKNTNIKASFTNDDLFINNNGYFLNNTSNKNTLINNNNSSFSSSGVYSQLNTSNENILINNDKITTTDSHYNFILNTYDLKLYGSNNLVYTPKILGGGFIGQIIGDNNVLFSLKPNIHHTIHSNVLTFGNIQSTSGVHIKDGNVIIGSVEIDSTLTTNNQIFGAKTLQNINHSGQINNIFLNVDEFIVPESNTVYLPYKFYSIYLGNYGMFNIGNITGNQFWNFPDKSGTVALLDDISSSIDSTTAGNGLSMNGIMVKLGGTLTEDTVIDGTNFNLTINVNDFIVNASTNTIILKTNNTENIIINNNGIGLNTIPNNINFGYIKSNLLTNSRIYQLPNKNGTIALEEDIPLIGDVNITNVQEGDFLVYNSASTSWINLDIPFLSGTNMVIDISYGDLYSLWTSSGLITGAYYRFDYQTIHKIPYTSTINYASVEKLIAFAIAPNKLDKLVWSPLYPQDIIYYRIDDRIVNESVEDTLLIDGETSGFVGFPYIPPPQTVDVAYIPTVMRPGRIYYREDTVARCSTPYDFRGVKFRRYKLKTPYELESGVKQYVDGTVMNTGDIVKVNGNIYMAKFLFTCSTSGGTLASDTTFFYNITSFLNNSLLNNNYVSPTPDTYIFADNRDTPYSSLILKVDNTDYVDLTTFNNTYVKSYNCHIENYIPAWLEQVTWEYYPNVIFRNYTNNINVGIFSENITIINSCNVDIDNYCKNMFISTYNSYLCQTKIGARCENIFIENVYVSAANSQTNYLYHTIGISNKNIINSKIANVSIGDKNLSLYMFATQDTRIGSQNQFTGLFGLTGGGEILQSKLGDFNTNVSYSHFTYNNYIGDKNNLIILPTASHDNVVGNNNSFISGIKSAVDSMEGVSVGGAFYENTIGNNNTSIVLAGFQNVVEDNVEGIFVSEYVSFNNSTFKSGSGYLTIDAGTNSLLGFIGTVFDYNRNILGSKTLTLNIQSINMNYLNFNMYDFSGGDTLVALRFVAYTDPSTYTTIAQRLYLT